MKGFKIIGHRGWGPTHNDSMDSPYPENTLIAFDHALKGGADGIEFDVLLSKDGIPVIIHDRHLHRHVIPEQQARVAGRFVHDFTFEELQTFQLGQKQKILSLEELLIFINEKYPEAILNMDVKSPDLVQPILNEIDKYFYDRKENIVISSYDWDLLRLFRQQDADLNLVPAIKSSLLFGAENVRPEDFLPLVDHYQDIAREKVIALYNEIKCIAFDCSVTDLKQPLIEWAEHCGIGLQISTSNNRVDAEHTDYDMLRMLRSIADKQLPFVICKVDEPSLVQERLKENKLYFSGSHSSTLRAPHLV